MMVDSKLLQGGEDGMMMDENLFDRFFETDGRL